MQIISGTTEFKSEDRTAVAIGKFDGIHLGHRELLKQILRAKEDGLKTTIFTFDPSPAVFFSGKEQAELTTKNEKRRIFERLGVDLLVEFPMNAQTAAIPAERFVKEILCERLQTRFLAAGTDLSFGDQGKGNWHLLKALSGEYGYQIQVLDKMLYEGREISSTFVREELKKGNMELVTRLLGEPYSITGYVAHGKQLGRTIGMPTMNLLPGEDKLLPPAGVYFSRVLLEGKEYAGITNIGRRPTVSSSGRTSVETYIYDFEQMIYDEFAEVQLYSFSRPERQFSGVEELKRNMEEDLEKGRVYWTEK